MSALNIPLFLEACKDIYILFLFVSLSGAMVSLNWLELPISRKKFQGPKDVLVCEVRL